MKQVFCCYKSKKSKQLKKIVDVGKYKLGQWFDIRTQILKLDYPRVEEIGELDINTGEAKL